MLISNHIEDYEVTVPFQTLQMVGHTVHAVCPNKRVGNSTAIAVHDFEGTQTYSGKLGHRFTVNATFADVDPTTYGVLVMPDGRTPEYLRLSAHVPEIVHHFFRTSKPVAVICHGARLLSTAGVLEDKAYSAYPACGPEITAAGGTFKNTPVGQTHTDGKLVTAPAWPVHPAWLAQFLEVLGTQVLHWSGCPHAGRSRSPSHVRNLHPRQSPFV